MTGPHARLTLPTTLALATLSLLLAAPMAVRGQGCPLWQYAFPSGLGHAVVAAAGDVNADMIPDVVAGWEEGQVAVLLSGADGSVIHTLNGLPTGYAFGRSAAGVGDVDGDAIPDVVVGARGYCPFGGPGIYGNGYVQLFSGATGNSIKWVMGSSCGDAFGISVAAAGHVDADPHADVLVGAVQDDNNGNGYVRVVSGGLPAGQDTILTILGSPAPQAPIGVFGLAVASIGDLDNDGISEIAVGNPTCGFSPPAGGGRVTVHSGAPSANGAILFEITGAGACDNLGISLVSLGDVDGDGIPDFAAGANSASGNHVLIISGASTTASPVILSSSNVANSDSLAALGDVNGDGICDFASDNPAKVFSGASGVLLIAYGNVNQHHSLAGPGDLNSDGTPDLVIGSGNQVLAYPCPPITGPEYQVNSADASLSFGTLPAGTPCSPLTYSMPVNGLAWLSMTSTHLGMPWGLGHGLVPLVPASGGGSVTFDNQVVNLDLTDPTFTLLWSGTSGPGFSTIQTGFVPGAAGALSAQMIIVAPNKPTGAALSQPIRLIVQ